MQSSLPRTKVRGAGEGITLATKRHKQQQPDSCTDRPKRKQGRFFNVLQLYMQLQIPASVLIEAQCLLEPRAF